jgi:hypothetical protein
MTHHQMDQHTQAYRHHVFHRMPMAGSDNVKKLVSGGDPMFLSSPITLCGRVDLNADRFFRLAELSIFDEALNKQQVALLNGIINMPIDAHESPRSSPSCAKASLVSDARRWHTSTPRVSVACRTCRSQVLLHCMQATYQYVPQLVATAKPQLSDAPAVTLPQLELGSTT